MNAVFGHSADAFPLVGAGRNMVRCTFRVNRSGAVPPPEDVFRADALMP